MIIEHFLKHDKITKDQKDYILHEYKTLIELLANKNTKFRQYTIKSIKKGLLHLQHIDSSKLDKLKNEDLTMLAMIVQAMLVHLDQRGIQPEINQVKHNSNQF